MMEIYDFKQKKNQQCNISHHRFHDFVLQHCGLLIFSQSTKMKSMRSRIRMHDDTMFWKKVAREYNAVEEVKVKEMDMAAKQGDM